MVESMAHLITGRSRMNENGQVTVPAEMRETLGLEEGESKVKWVYVDGEVRLYKIDEE